MILAEGRGAELRDTRLGRRLVRGVALLDTVLGVFIVRSPLEALGVLSRFDLVLSGRRPTSSMALALRLYL